MIWFNIALAAPQYCYPASRTELGKKKVEIHEVDESSSRAAGVMLDVKGDVVCGLGGRTERLERTGGSFSFVELEHTPPKPVLFEGDLIGGWSPADRARVDQAWSYLSKKEREILRQARFKREKGEREPSVKRGALAKAIFPIEGPTVRVWDGAMQVDRTAPTVGTESQPVYLLVHELGHLLSRAAAAEMNQVLAKGKTPELWSCRTQAVTVLGREGVFQEKVELPISAVGEDASEAFADTFALFKLEPAWLKQHHPTAHAFFANEQHLDWRTQEGLVACGEQLDQLLHQHAMSEEAH